MSTDSKREAAALRKVAKVLRAWGELYGADSPEAREAALSAPEGREVARTALDLATRHFRTIMAASNRWGCDKSARLAVHLLQEFTAERGRTDLGKYWYRCHAFTQRRQPGEMALPDQLDDWADKFEKAEDVSEGGGGHGADAPGGRWRLRAVVRPRLEVVGEDHGGVFGDALAVGVLGCEPLKG